MEDKALEPGTPFDRDRSLYLREEVIKWRDASFDQWPDAIPFTIAATELISWMYIAIDRIWPVDKQISEPDLSVRPTFEDDDYSESVAEDNEAPSHGYWEKGDY